MANPPPFYPVAAAWPQPLAPQPQTSYLPPAPIAPCHAPPAQQSVEEDEVYCYACEGLIENNDDGIELFFGIVGRSPQTGRKMIVPNPEKRPTDVEVVTVHTTCVLELVAEHIMPEQFYEMLDSMAMERAEEMRNEETEEAGLARRIEDPDS